MPSTVGIVASHYTSAAAPFLPTAIAGCQLWLDGADASSFTYSSSTVVSQWADKSGGARHWTQATVAYQPNRNGTQNALTTVAFDGTNDYLGGPNAAVASQPNTVLVVSKYISRTAGKHLIDVLSDAAAGRQLFTGDTNWRFFAGGSLIDSGIAGDTTWHLSTIVYNGASSTLRKDLVQIAAGNVGANSFGAVGNAAIIGAGGNSSGLPIAAACQIAELLVYSGVLSPTDRDNVESYLKTKWGTVPALPTVAGLKAHYDGADPASFVYSSGTSVSQWSDKSGNGNHFVQGTVSLQPNRNATIGGVTAVDFDSDSMAPTALFMTTGPGSILYVHQVDADPSVASQDAAFVNMWGGSSQNVHIPFVDGNIYDDFGSSVRYACGNPTPSMQTSPALMSVVSAAGDWRMYVNGTLQYSSASNTVGWGATPRLGGAGSNYFAGRGGEILVYSVALSTTDRQALEAYLKAKWGTP